MTKLKHEYLDVVALMLNNYREDKPILEGAVLFKGSRSADGGSSHGDAELRAYLLPQVAAQASQGLGKENTFIHAYPVDRDTTKFYPAGRHADHLRGQPVTSYSVADVERALRPHVENLSSLDAGAPAGHRGYLSQTQALEKFIKASFYEAGVPSRTAAGSEVKPVDSFYYSGGPKVEKTADVLGSMARVTPESSTKERETVSREPANDVTVKLAKLVAENPETSKAFQVLYAAAVNDLKNTIAKHGDKPATLRSETARTEPPTENQTRLLRLAQGLSDSLRNPNPVARERAIDVAGHLGKLNTESATVADVSREVSRLNQAGSSTKAPTGYTVGAPAGKAPAAPATASLARMR